MEAVIVAIAALAALVLIDAGYWIAMSLARWSPAIAAGVLAGWLAHHHGAQSLEALGVGLLGSVVARHYMRQRFISEDKDFY